MKLFEKIFLNYYAEDVKEKEKEVKLIDKKLYDCTAEKKWRTRNRKQYDSEVTNIRESLTLSIDSIRQVQFTQSENYYYIELYKIGLIEFLVFKDENEGRDYLINLLEYERAITRWNNAINTLEKYKSASPEFKLRTLQMQMTKSSP